MEEVAAGKLKVEGTRVSFQVPLYRFTSSVFLNRVCVCIIVKLSMGSKLKVPPLFNPNEDNYETFKREFGDLGQLH